jgi:ubiquinone/menaquinone biosynthesis C-methylase UbiE
MKHKSKKELSLFYDQFLADYSDEKERSNSGQIRLAISLGKNASMVLDAGCGRGVLTHLLSKALSDSYVIGVDISRKSCRIAHNRKSSQNKKGEFLVADLSHLPFRDSSFDLIVFSEVLEHIFLMEREKVLYELRRVAKPYGNLLLTTPNGLHPIILLRIFLSWVSRGIIQLSNQIYDYPPLPSSLIASLKKAGWKIKGLYFDNYSTGTRIRIRVPNLPVFAIQFLVVASPKVSIDV